MIEFKSLTLRNFLSFGNVPTVVEFQQHGTTLILGENLDDTESGVGANGVGKSTILNALVYGLYDKPVSNITKDNLVNNINKKNMQVTIEFSKKGVTYLVKRERKMKAGAAGNNVFLYKDGKDITPDSASHTNDSIVRILGIPYELFVRIVAFSATHIPFLDLPLRSHYAANQTDIIEELFSLKTLSEKATLLKERIKQTEQDLQTQKTRLQHEQREFDRHVEQLQSAERRVMNWHQTQKQNIAETHEQISWLESINAEQQRQLHDQLTDIDKQLTAALSQQTSLERAINRATKRIEELTRELTHLSDDKCPYCLQKYENAQVKIDETSNLLKEAQDKLTQTEDEYIQLSTSIEQLASQHKHIKNQITVDNYDALLDTNSKLLHLKAKVEELETQTNPYVEPLEELHTISFAEPDLKPVNELTTLLDHQQFLLKLLTKRDSFVRKNLLTKNIPFLNTRLSTYLSDLGLPHTVEFTQEMTASISQFGRPMDFGNLSNGQRARVNLALSFAFRDVLQQMHEHVNVCMLDEVLDVGLDTIGVQAAAKMLKRKARTENTSIYIISHRDEIDSAFDKVLTVQYSRGFSTIKTEE